MGTINYGTSKYITLGVKPYDTWDFEKDKAYMEEVRERIEEMGEDVNEESISRIISGDIECWEETDYDNAKFIIDKYDLENFKVEIRPGYYSGAYLNIEPYWDAVLDSYETKCELNKEITQLKELLLELVDYGWVACHPWWCTTYETKEETKKSIIGAIKEIREEVRTTPTLHTYKGMDNPYYND